MTRAYAAMPRTPAAPATPRPRCRRDATRYFLRASADPWRHGPRERGAATIYEFQFNDAFVVTSQSH